MHGSTLKTRLLAGAVSLTLVISVVVVVSGRNAEPTGEILIPITPVSVTGSNGPLTLTPNDTTRLPVTTLTELPQTVNGMVFDLDVTGDTGTVTVNDCTDGSTLPDAFLPNDAPAALTVFTPLSPDGSVCVTATAPVSVTLTARAYIPENGPLKTIDKRIVANQISLAANQSFPVAVSNAHQSGAAVIQLTTTSDADHTVSINACTDAHQTVPIAASAGTTSSSQLLVALSSAGAVCVTASEPTVVNLAVTALTPLLFDPHVLSTEIVAGTAIAHTFGSTPRAHAAFAQPQIHAGQPTALIVDLFAQNIAHGETVTVNITVPETLTITGTSGGFRCETAHPTLTCTRFSTSWPKSLTVELDTTNATSGLHGATAQVVINDTPAHASPWEASSTQAHVDIALLHVLSGLTDTPTSTPIATLTTLNEPQPRASHAADQRVPWQKIALSRENNITTQAEPSTEFCNLLGALGKPNDSVTIGPVKFWNLTDASANQNDCNPLSELTLKHVNITIGPVTFENVTATATPTSLTFTSTLAGTNIELAVSGGFPEPGSKAIGAAVTFDVGNTRMTVSGELDYTDSETFSVTLTTADSGWQPLPGLSVNQTAVSGTYRKTATSESFEVDVAFTGKWHVSSDVKISSVTAGLTLTDGVMGVTFSGNIDGSVNLQGVTLPLPKTITGTLDENGVASLSVDLQPFTLENVVKFDPFVATFTFYPDGPTDDEEEFSLAGTATFVGPYAKFFTASTTGSISVRADGIIVTAEMSVVPAGFDAGVGPLIFTYALPNNPDISMPFTLPGGNPNVKIPLPSGVPVATVPFGVPEQLTKNKDFAVLKNVGHGVASVSLDAAQPGFTVYYEPPQNTFLFGTATTTPRMEFDDIFLGVSLGIEEKFVIGGQVTLTLPDQTQLAFIAELDLIVSETGFAVDGELTLASAGGWRDPFGMTGVTLNQLSIDVGISDLLPSLGLFAVASLPGELTNPLGVNAASVITVGAELAAADPCLIFDISPPAGKPKMNVLSIADGGLTATNAQLVAAPFGCTFGNTTYPSGFRLAFDGAIENVTTTFEATFTLAPFTFNASGEIGTFTLDGITFTDTTANLGIGLNGVSFGLTVGIEAGDALSGSGKLLLTPNGGFIVDATGKIVIDGSPSDVTIKATNCKDSTCQSLVTPSFFASGDITSRGFGFQASISVTGTGDFDATLTIPKNTFKFHLNKDRFRTDVKVNFGMKLVVSNHSDSALTVDAGASLSNCKAQVAQIWWDCPKGSVSTHTTIKTRELDFKIDYSATIAGAKVSGGGTGQFKT